MDKVEHGSLGEALLAVQEEIENPVKNANNPHLKTKYADYNAVKDATVPVYNKHGVLVKQRKVVVDGKAYLKTTLFHIKTGEKDEEDLTEIVFNGNNPQAYGSGVSYARRYGLQTVSGTGAEDDDAEKAKAGNNKQQGQPLPPQKNPPNNNTKNRTPIESKLAACKTIEVLQKEFKALTEDEQKANAKFCTQIKDYITQKAEEATKQANNGQQQQANQQSK